MKPAILLVLLFIVFCSVGSFGQDVLVQITEQPKPEMPQNYGTLDLQASAILRIQFLSDGKLGDIAVVVKIPYTGMTELALDAAKKIRFVPAIKDGKPTDSFRMVQYTYSWDGGWKVFPSKSGLNAHPPTLGDEKAEAIIARAVQQLGGDKYLQVRSQVGRGKFSVIRDGAIASFQSFVDAIVFPDRERTEFKSGGARTVQVNTGDTGWIFDGEQELIKIQSPVQVENFKRGLRTSLDNLLRGYWKGDAELSYVGRRPSTLGKRNDVVRLTYKDGLTVEFEFAVDDGIPQKAIYKTKEGDSEPVTEEDHYAQFIEVSGIKTPFIIDRFTAGKQASRINYDSIEFNKTIPDSAFARPSNPKDAKKDIKY